jgi:hypothetical protein
MWFTLSSVFPWSLVFRAWRFSVIFLLVLVLVSRGKFAYILTWENVTFFPRPENQTVRYCCFTMSKNSCLNSLSVYTHNLLYQRQINLEKMSLEIPFTSVCDHSLSSGPKQPGMEARWPTPFGPPLLWGPSLCLSFAFLLWELALCSSSHLRQLGFISPVMGKSQI